jgi:hypothetical protein
MVRVSRRLVISAGAGLSVASMVPVGAAAVAAPKLSANLDAFKRFIGTWRGEGEGQPGKSTVERTYEPTLGGQYILVRNRSTYAPQEKNPKGEVHDDVGYMSFDKARKRLVLRQFNVEGFVNQFVAATPAIDGDALVMDSEAIENIPAGWRARESYRFISADGFEEIFELAEPGKAFEVYSHNRLKRQP